MRACGVQRSIKITLRFDWRVLIFNREFHFCCRKKLTTAQYIYQALFKEEKSSDITVSARGKLWRLHKVYLSQSPYFASMFGGNWRETHKDFIDIDVVDPRITEEC